MRALGSVWTLIFVAFCYEIKNKRIPKLSFFRALIQNIIAVTNFKFASL